MNISGVHIIRYIFFLTAFDAMLTGCREEESLEVFFEEEELLITAYLEEHPEDYSSLIRVLELTNLKSTLNAYGHYTFFAPDNLAFEAFLAEQGKSSLDEFDTDFLTTLVRYHLLDQEIESSYFRDGVIQDTTFSGDRLVITLSAGGQETIMVNEANVTERDIHLENGILHRLDGVMTPIVGSIMDRIDETEGFSIISESLEISGLSDTLGIIRIDLNEDIFIRTRFTIFAEPDEVYNREGIMTAADLVARYSDTGDPTGSEDGFFQYMAYHVVPGLYFLNVIDSFNYATLAKNYLINVRVTENISLNSIEGEPEGSSIMIVEERSNRQAKNGVFHEIDHMLIPREPPPAYLVVDLTDYQGISIGHVYTEEDLMDIPGISCDHTGIYYRNSILGDGETNLQTTTDNPGWLVEFDLAPILRGKYDVNLYFASYHDNTNKVQGFWDGARFGGVLDFEHQKRDPQAGEWLRDFNTSEYIGRLLLTETSSHKLKFISLEGGYGNFDYLEFIPLEE